MADFWNLVRNENMKIYVRPGTWVMFGFVVLIPLAISLLVYLTMNEIGEPATGGNWELMLFDSQLLFPLITIFTVVKASEAVAGEFSWGTIKLLLIRPWSRAQILLSKYIAVLLFALFFTASAFILTLLINMVLFGYSSSSPGVEISPWLYMLEYYGLRFISLIVVVSFGFMLSSAFRSSGLAIGLSIFILLSGNLAAMVLNFIDKPWVRFVLFPNLDLTSYMNGGTGPFVIVETTLGFSIAVLAAYVVIFNVISWLVFCKSDITS